VGQLAGAAVAECAHGQRQPPRATTERTPTTVAKRAHDIKILLSSPFKAARSTGIVPLDHMAGFL
jgi:hypothetical protein